MRPEGGDGVNYQFTLKVRKVYCVPENKKGPENKFAINEQKANVM